MSHVTYEELLREAMVDLSEMYEQDAQWVGKPLGVNKKNDHAFFMHHWTATYLRYIQIARKLVEVHDNMLHPQKRGDVRIVLDSCLARLLELKNTLVEHCGEYVNLDEALVDLKLTPDALEIPIPRYFVEERREQAKHIKDMIRDFQQAAAHSTSEGENALPRILEGIDPPPPPPNEMPMTLEQAIEILQNNERGRQGRQRAKFLKTIFEQQEYQKPEFGLGGTGIDRDQAAVKIQKTVLGYLARKKTSQMLTGEMEFLGMEASKTILSNAQKEKLEKALLHRKQIQRQNFDELVEGARSMRERIKVQEGAKTMEEMLDEVLMHMATLRFESADGVIPQLPTEEEGGSLALLQKIPNPKAEEEARKKAEEEAKKPAGKEPAKGDKNEEVEVAKVQPSMFWDRFANARDRYVKVWHPAFQETYFDNKDFDQRFDKRILREEILEGPGGTLTELRKCVDQLVMVEVNCLKERMDRQSGKKGRALPKVKPKPKPKWKDPIEETVMDLMNQLVQLNMLQIPDDRVRLADYLGAHNMMESAFDENSKLQAEQADETKAKWQQLIDNWSEYTQTSLGMTKDQFQQLFDAYSKQKNWMFEPSMLQVRQSVTEYCILPLGSQIIHDFVQPQRKAVLFYGFAKSGKTMLTQAVCNETAATLFNLSPHVLNSIPDQFAGALGKFVAKLFRVARAMAPSVIYIDEIEKIFAGKGKGKGAKKKGEGAGRAGKIKKDLLQQMKELDPSDRVLIIGNTRCPWDADLKDVCSTFNAAVCCVHPDYASRMVLWKELIAKKGITLPNDRDYEVLAYMTNKYTSGVIAKIIDETLTERRVKRAIHRAVRPDEFLPALARAQPIFKEDYQAMEEFVEKLPMTMRRVFEADFEETVVEEKGPKQKAKK